MTGRILIVVLFLFSTRAISDLKTDIGYSKLKAELNSLGQILPDGNSVEAVLVEACGNSVDDDNNPETPPTCLAWLPNLNDQQFKGKTIFDASTSTTGLFSNHATGVARLYFGNSSSIAPGINNISAYFAEHWLEGGYLQATNPALLPLISPSRIASHSWIGSVGTKPEDQIINADILRRVDWLINKDELIQTVGLSNGSANQALLSSAFNVIAVGRSDGGHGQGSAGVDATYTAGRTRPDLVVPLSTSSTATPVVAAAAALLIETGHNNASLSTDPQLLVSSNRAGDAIYNAERSEVIKAVLMAGANRTAIANNITDYRSANNRTANGLDKRYGAGQLNIANSYRILTAGEQNTKNGRAAIKPTGFDYAPQFGNATNQSEANYTFSTGSETEMLSVSLAWNIDIDEETNGEFKGTARLYDLNLMLFDVTEQPIQISSSTSRNENSEHLWLALNGNRDYMIKVIPAPNQVPFSWDYAIAWKRTPDTDQDSIANDQDNCILTSNANQKDTDSDGFGNLCDGDLNNDGKTNTLDLNLYRLVHRSKSGDTRYNLNSDFNSDGKINTLDLNIYRILHRSPPGPSGLIFQQ